MNPVCGKERRRLALVPGGSSRTHRGEEVTAHREGRLGPHGTASPNQGQTHPHLPSPGYQAGGYTRGMWCGGLFCEMPFFVCLPLPQGFPDDWSSKTPCPPSPTAQCLHFSSGLTGNILLTGHLPHPPTSRHQYQIFMPFVLA